MKKAIVLGATSGIGKSLAHVLVKKNYMVGIAGRREKFLEQLKATKPESYVAKTIDITDLGAVVEKLKELIGELGGLDLLILSSGVGDINEDLNFYVEKNTIDTNILGFTCVVDWAFDYFKNQGHGHLVVISSVGGLRGAGMAPAYNATKAYQINYLEGLCQRVASLKIPVVITDIRSGLVDTDMAKGSGLFWVMPVEKVVAQIYKAISKKKKVAYVTKRWRVVAQILKIIPRVIYEKL